MAVIARKRGQKWEYRFEGALIGGKRQQFSKSGFSTKKEAMDAGIAMYMKYTQAGTCIIPSEISFSDYLDLWLKECCEPNLKYSTLEGYRKKIRLYIKPSLGQYKLKALSALVLQHLINDLWKKGLSRNTLSVIKGILSSSISYAMEPLNYISVNPMTYVKLPSKRLNSNNAENTNPHVYIPKDRMIRIFERFPVNSSAHIPLMLGYKCGLRLGEAFALTWNNIDFKNKTLTVEKQVQWKSLGNNSGYWYFSLPKYNSMRTITIDDELLELLKSEYAKQEKSKVLYDEYYRKYYESKDGSRRIVESATDKQIDFVTVRESGEYINPRIMQNASMVIHKSLNQPDFTYHSLRHTHCTMLLQAGAMAKYVQQRLGHKNIQVTLQIYQHLTDEMSEKGDEVLNGIDFMNE